MEIVQRFTSGYVLDLSKSGALPPMPTWNKRHKRKVTKGNPFIWNTLIRIGGYRVPVELYQVKMMETKLIQQVPAPKSTKEKLNESVISQIFLYAVCLNWPDIADVSYCASLRRIVLTATILTFIGLTIYVACLYISTADIAFALGAHDAAIGEDLAAACFFTEAFTFIVAIIYGYRRLLRPFSPLEMRYFS